MRRGRDVAQPRHLRVEARLAHHRHAMVGAGAVHGEHRAGLGALDRQVAVEDALAQRAP